MLLIPFYINRCVRPVLFFRNTRWPWPFSLADAQRKLQRRMLVQILRIERWPVEPLNVLNQRCFRAASDVASRYADWGTEHAKRVCSWAEHLLRPRNSDSLAALFYGCHSADWLQARRNDPEIGGHARPGTRSGSGPVCARWDESVARTSTTACLPRS